MNPFSTVLAAEKPRILLVEDHAMFREQVAQLITQDFGMSVCGQANNIHDATTLARETRPDMAIVDITLKGCSGLEMLKDWKAQEIDVPTRSEQMMENMVGKMAGRETAGPAVHRLANRELEVFHLIGAGRSTREIAETLHLGVTTVDTYRTRIKEKLGLASGTELLRFAARWLMQEA
jgi:DNA-binding NarL/FixJ family response regulator